MTSNAPEELALLGRVLNHAFLEKSLERRRGHLARKGVATERRSVLSRLDAQHNVVVGEDSRDGHDTARESLSENDNVGSRVVVVRGEHLHR